MDAGLEEIASEFASSTYDPEISAHLFFAQHDASAVHARVSQLARLKTEVESTLKTKVVQNYRVFMRATQEINAVDDRLRALKALAEETAQALATIRDVRIAESLQAHAAVVSGAAAAAAGGRTGSAAGGGGGGGGAAAATGALVGVGDVSDEGEEDGLEDDEEVLAMRGSRGGRGGRHHRKTNSNVSSVTAGSLMSDVAAAAASAGGERRGSGREMVQGMHGTQRGGATAAVAAAAAAAGLPQWFQRAPADLERFIIEHQYAEAVSLVHKLRTFSRSVQDVVGLGPVLQGVNVRVDELAADMVQRLKDQLDSMACTALWGQAEQRRKLSFLIRLGHADIAAQAFARSQADTMRRSLRMVEGTSDPLSFISSVTRSVFPPLVESCEVFLNLVEASAHSSSSVANTSSSATAGDASDTASLSGTGHDGAGFVAGAGGGAAAAAAAAAADGQDISQPLSHLIMWITSELASYARLVGRQMVIGASRRSAWIVETSKGLTHDTMTQAASHHAPAVTTAATLAAKSFSGGPFAFCRECCLVAMNAIRALDRIGLAATASLGWLLCQPLAEVMEIVLHALKSAVSKQARHDTWNAVVPCTVAKISLQTAEQVRTAVAAREAASHPSRPSSVRLSSLSVGSAGSLSADECDSTGAGAAGGGSTGDVGGDGDGDEVVLSSSGVFLVTVLNLLLADFWSLLTGGEGVYTREDFALLESLMSRTCSGVVQSYLHVLNNTHTSGLQQQQRRHHHSTLEAVRRHVQPAVARMAEEQFCTIPPELLIGPTPPSLTSSSAPMISAQPEAQPLVPQRDRRENDGNGDSSASHPSGTAAEHLSNPSAARGEGATPASAQSFIAASPSPDGVTETRRHRETRKRLEKIAIDNSGGTADDDDSSAQWSSNPLRGR